MMLAASPSLAAGAGNCGNAGQTPGRATVHEMRQGVLCLVNVARTNHGMLPLRYNEDLRRAAEGHSADMVERGYFSHTGPGGRGPMARVARTGYGGFSRIGEDIGWVTGHMYGSAAGMFDAWMRSAVHRANILDPRYRDLGVGVSRGSPNGGGRGAATYTLDFGSRLGH
jgi:uncharacterized protein YkwD